MPIIRITNNTTQPLNLAVCFLLPVHFCNSLHPGQTWETDVGSIWYKFECRRDKVGNRYSISKSAKTIGLVSLTGASIAAVAIPLTVTLAPVVGVSSAVLTSLASQKFIIAAAAPEILTLTTWIATNLTKKTIYQLASDRGANADELEETLQTTTSVIDGVSYLCLSSLSLNSKGKESHANGKPSPVVKSMQDVLLGFAANSALNQGMRSWNDSFGAEGDLGTTSSSTQENQGDVSEDWFLVERNNPVSSDVFQVCGVYLGFEEAYEFEWREVNRSGKQQVLELWDLTNNHILE